MTMFTLIRRKPMKGRAKQRDANARALLVFEAIARGSRYVPTAQRFEISIGRVGQCFYKVARMTALHERCKFPDLAEVRADPDRWVSLAAEAARARGWFE